MNKSELQEVFMEKKIPFDIYSLNGGLPNECFCLNVVDDGWEVYYSERGVKSQRMHFNTEEAACEYLYVEVVKLIRG